MEESKEGTVQLGKRTIVKKITSKSVAGKISLEKLIAHNTANPGSVMPLYGVIGLAADFVAGQSEHGPYVRLLGQFKAINVETGEEFRSGACILPGAASDLVFGALRGLGEGGGSIEFALRVGVKRDETSAVGYVFVIEQVYEPTKQDAIGALESRLSLPTPASNVQQISDRSKADNPDPVPAAQSAGSRKR
jgi:hypothetical protein